MGISISISMSISVRSAANQQALYAYVNHGPTEHKHERKTTCAYVYDAAVH